MVDNGRAECSNYWIVHCGFISRSDKFFVTKGQTIGKIIFKLQRITKNGDRVNPVISLLRSLSFIIYFFTTDPSILPEGLNMIFSYIGTPFFIGLIWFSLIRPGSRSAHDYLFGTYIVETNIPEFETCQLTLKKSFMPILLSVFLFGGYLFHLSNNSISVNYTESMGKAYAQIQTLPNVQIAGISEESNKYTISIQETKLPFDNHKLSVQAACSLINNLRLSDPNQQIQTIIVNGYDMKIYRSWNYYAKNLSLREWKMEESKLIQKPIDRK